MRGHMHRTGGTTTGGELVSSRRLSDTARANEHQLPHEQVTAAIAKQGPGTHEPQLVHEGKSCFERLRAQEKEPPPWQRPLAKAWDFLLQVTPHTKEKDKSRAAAAAAAGGAGIRLVLTPDRGIDLTPRNISIRFESAWAARSARQSYDVQ